MYVQYAPHAIARVDAECTKSVRLVYDAMAPMFLSRTGLNARVDLFDRRMKELETLLSIVRST